MTDTTNVILFPKVTANVPPPSEVFSRLTEVKEDEIEIIVDMICSNILDTFENAGFQTGTDITTIQDVCFLLESVRSLVEKFYGIHHPFHDLSGHCFRFQDEKLVFTNPKFNIVTEEKKE